MDGLSGNLTKIKVTPRLLLFTSAPSRSMTSIKATLLRLSRLASSLSALESKILAFEQGVWEQCPTKPWWTWQISHRPNVCHQRHPMAPTCPNQWSAVLGFTSGSPRALLPRSFCAAQQTQGQEASHHEPTRFALIFLSTGPASLPLFFLYQELLK